MNEQEVPVEEHVEEPKQIDPQVIERARLQGWVPEDEFRGDKERWIPADEFVSRADNMMPILKSVNKKLETKLERLEREFKEKDETLKKIVNIQNKYATDTHTSRISNIEQRRRKAAAEGDLEEYDRLSQEINKIEKPETIDIKTPDSDTKDVPEGMQRWQSENSWFGKDTQLTEDAIMIGELMAKRNDPLAYPGREYEMANAIKDKLKVMYPDKFKNPNQDRQEIDESGFRDTSGQVNNKGKTWNDLPADAKQYWTNSGQYIPGYTVERYVKDFFEEA